MARDSNEGSPVSAPSPARSFRKLPAWIWIIIIPLVCWSALLLVLAFLGFVPLGLLGWAGPADSAVAPVPDQSIRVLKGHTGSVKAVAFSPDGATLASAGEESAGRVKLWRVVDGSLIYSIDAHEGGAYSLAFSPDGQFLASGGQDGLVRLWNAADGTHVRDLTGSVADLTSVAFSPDGRTIAAGSWGRPWMDAVDTVHLWRVADGAPLLQLKGNPRVATSVTFSPDGQYLAAGGDDHRDSPGVYIWHLPDGRLVKTIEGLDSWSVEFAPPGEQGTNAGESATLAVGSGSISLVKVPDGSVMRTIPYEGGELGQSLAFSADGALLATGSWDNTVRLWRVVDGKELQTWRGHSTFVESVAFSPDGKLVASGSLDDTVRLWRVPASAGTHTLDK